MDRLGRPRRSDGRTGAFRARGRQPRPDRSPATISAVQMSGTYCAHDAGWRACLITAAVTANRTPGRPSVLLQPSCTTWRGRLAAMGRTPRHPFARPGDRESHCDCWVSGRRHRSSPSVSPSMWLRRTAIQPLCPLPAPATKAGTSERCRACGTARSHGRSRASLHSYEPRLRPLNERKARAARQRIEKRHL